MNHPSFQPLNPGDVFLGEYTVLRLLGAGGMGAVYHVIDAQGTQAHFALKVMQPELAKNAEFRRRFSIEARIPAGLASDHIVRVIRTGIDEGTGLPFILMELLNGVDLGRRIRPGCGLPIEYALMLLHQAARTLDVIHRSGVVHRDLKPENLVVVLSDNDEPRLKIVDFGIAKCILMGGRPATTLGVGTIQYQAPEQMRGDRDIGPAADLYSLAHVTFALLTGQPYWVNDDCTVDSPIEIFRRMEHGTCERATARAKRMDQYLSLPVDTALPDGFDPWFAKATTFDPKDRFRSASEMVEALAALYRQSTGFSGVLPSEAEPYREPELAPQSESPASTVGRPQPSDASRAMAAPESPPPQAPVGAPSRDRISASNAQRSYPHDTVNVSAQRPHPVGSIAPISATEQPRRGNTSSPSRAIRNGIVGLILAALACGILLWSIMTLRSHAPEGQERGDTGAPATSTVPLQPPAATVATTGASPAVVLVAGPTESNPGMSGAPSSGVASSKVVRPPSNGQERPARISTEAHSPKERSKPADGLPEYH